MLYIVIGLDDEASVATRDALRPQHVEYVLADESSIQFVGPMRHDEEGGSICGSVYVFEAESAAHVQAWLDAEPYHQAGVYREVIIQPFEVRKNQLPHRSLR